jgi:hypothetical protein
VRVQIELDEVTMHLFPQWIAREDTERTVDSDIVLLMLRMEGEKLPQSSQVEATEPFPLDEAPVFIAIEHEVRSVQRNRLAIELCLPYRRSPLDVFCELAMRLEFRHVEPDVTRRVEPDGLGVDPEVRLIITLKTCENLLETPQRCVQAVSRLLIIQLTPEKAGQLIARVHGVTTKQEVGQQVFDPLARKPAERPPITFQG